MALNQPSSQYVSPGKPATGSSQGHSTLHLLLRIVGLTGGVAGIVGLILLFAVADRAEDPADASRLAQIGIGLLIGGALAVSLGFLFELRAVAGLVGSRRGAVGSNVALQVLLLLALVLGINAFSFFHYVRADWTREHLFTIPDNIRSELSKLRGETDIVVLERHASFGQVTDKKQDNYDSAAERKIVEKVKDLAEQFQELGPRFHVEVLDIQDDNYQEKLAAIKKKTPELADALEKASENSIFFSANHKVQRLAFHDIYQLDRTASMEGAGNLVLNYQGVGPFANKVLNIEAKTPRVGVAVIHPVLSLNDADVDFYSMNGAKKVFDAQGFDTVDIILKKGWEVRQPEATAYTFDENLFESLDEERIELEETSAIMKKQLAQETSRRDLWKNNTKEELNKLFIYVEIQGRFRLVDRPQYEKFVKSGRKVETSHIDDKDRARELQNYETGVTLLQLNLEKLEPELTDVRKKQKELKVENLEEQRRITDTKAKLTRLLADCDLLILPRQTFVDIPQEKVVPYNIHKLDEAQFGAVKDFMKSGRPVLFCLGPANDPESAPQPDAVDEALEAMGFKLPRQTILFNSEVKSFAQRRGGLLILGSAKVDIPPVEFDWKSALGFPGRGGEALKGSNPIRDSVNLTTRGIGKSKDLDLRLRYPRPVYFLKPTDKDQTPVVDESAVLMVTDPESWNEDNPFPTRERSPRFEPSKSDDPSFGTLEERRRGPFPIAAAAVVDLPKSWGEANEKVRVGVVGTGGAFVGKNLTPVQQKLLLDLSNWLLGRDDLLARANETWKYPRLALSGTANVFWQWGTRFLLPLFFVYLGLMVALVRRMR